ncbi:MAG: glycosyltransferase family 4 protein [Acidimicrobiaceae bacterium]|nr:glycosyltransferase family 4 protein [Acidimicrobiia bacterium]MCY4493125.1 glycosyltransferase family 4 protein [Acidimicrobiaceae bacterium]
MTDITFVTPRYGDEVIGGAEGAARSLATRLSADGVSVDVLASRARTYSTWEDDYPQGTSVEDGVSVHRFSIDYPRSKDWEKWIAQVIPRADVVPNEEGLAWIDNQGPTSSALIDAVADVSDGVLAFTPYLYHPTVRGLPVAKVPSIFHACAHPEPPLRMPLFHDVFGAATAFSHYSRAEQALVWSMFPKTMTTPQVVSGLPVELPAFEIDQRAARQACGLGDDRFVMCLGRITHSKGSYELVQSFVRARRQDQNVKLVMAGPVMDEPIDHPDVICVGSLSEERKFGLLAAADVLINPSPLESFSLVLLEAWLVETPVLVNGWCGATREHCVHSGGGLSYRTFSEFEVALNRLLGDDTLRSRLGRAGNAYTDDNFCWPAVRDRYQALLSRIA